MPLHGKHIVLGITGGIAAYKSVSLLRLLKKAGAEVQVIITPSGKEFITPVTLSALSGNPVISDFFTANTGEWHSHVDLGLWSDLMVIAPATASTIGKMANGIADNMLVTTYLSAKSPVIVAPAMDLDMYRHPSTSRNLEKLRLDGVSILEAENGELASGLIGKGRMAEPEMIYEKIVRHFSDIEKNKEFLGKSVLITAGPTYENLDPVRFIGNRSSGKMGFALANEFSRRGANVTVIAGPVSSAVTLLPGIKRIDVENAVEMLTSTRKYYPSADIAIFAAAVSDYRPEKVSVQKIKREKMETCEIRLVRNPDIASEMGKLKNPGQINVGFALETENGPENAKKKQKTKNFDMVILNSAGKQNEGFNSENNTITIFGSDGSCLVYDNKHKTECAKDIVNRIRHYIDSLKNSV